MKIESKDRKIKNLFLNKKYLIPDYQRNYSWDVNEEVLTFWDDFTYYLNNDGKSNFFIGPMVFKAEDIESSDFEVIDGQQRLITFSILISVLVSFFKKYGKEDLANGLLQYLIFRNEKNEEQLVIVTLDPHPFYQERIFHNDISSVPTKESEILIEKVRIFFNESIENLVSNFNDNEKINYLIKIRDYLFNIDTVVIISNDQTDAFTIFETINTRGKDLLSIDLLKNYIFKNFNYRSGIEEPKNSWKLIMDNVGIARDTFFNRFWSSWVAKITENKLYRRFNDYMRSDESNKVFKNSSSLLEELIIASKIYRKITKPKLDDWKDNNNYHIYNHIRNINGLFNLKVHFPFFLSIFEEYEKGKISYKLFNETLLFMENFHFIFTHIVSPRASGLDNKYSKFAIKLRISSNKQAVINELKEELYEKLPSFDEYKEKFEMINFKDDKDTIKFILLKLEKELDPSISVDFDLHSIEHLYPKSISNMKNLNEIGNMFLLEQKYNEDKGDLEPFSKLQDSSSTVIKYLSEQTKYKTTKMELENIIIKNKWGDSDIAERTKKLSQITYELFSKK